MQTQAAPQQATTYSYFWQFNAAQVSTGLQKFQAWVQNPDLPAEFGGEINLQRGSSKGIIRFNLAGAYYGSNPNPKSIIQPFLDSIVRPLLFLILVGDDGG